jgi:hypothetical protein
MPEPSRESAVPPRTSAAVAILVLFSLSVPVPAQVLVLRDGSRLEVESYEVQGELVVFHTVEGKLQSIPLSLVDLDATQRLELEAQPETIVLRFDWPVGVSARVETRRSREQEERGETRTTQGEARYRMTISSHPDGLHIRSEDFQLEVPETESELGREALERMSSLSPSYVVAVDGTFLRLEGGEALKTELARLLEPVRSRPEMNDEARAMLDRLMSDEFLRYLAEQEWNMLVGTWVGAELEPGAMYESASEAPLPIVPGATISMRHEVSAHGPVPCSETHPRPDCFRLELRSYPDPDEMKELVASLLQRVGGMSEGEASQLGALQTETELVVTAEPASLLPHRLELTRRIGAASAAEGNVRRVDRRVTVYDWAR